MRGAENLEFSRCSVDIQLTIDIVTEVPWATPWESRSLPRDFWRLLEIYLAEFLLRFFVCLSCLFCFLFVVTGDASPELADALP
jgi:hypothetical protein